MSLENFRKLLMVHRGARTRNTPDTGNQTVSLETNTSSFDRINLGPFYEEHQRQRKLLLVDSREPVNRTVSPNRRQQQQQQQQGGRRLQRVDAELRREMCSLPDVAVKDVSDWTEVLFLRPNPHWTRARKFAGNSFDVDCVQCEHSHLQHARCVTSPCVWCGLGLILAVFSKHATLKTFTRTHVYNLHHHQLYHQRRVKNSLPVCITF